MDYRKPFCVKSGEKVRLQKLYLSYTGKATSEDEAKKDAERYLKQARPPANSALRRAQTRRCSSSCRRMDAGGQGRHDQARHVSGVNAQGVDVASFKQPTPLELGA